MVNGWVGLSQVTLVVEAGCIKAEANETQKASQTKADRRNVGRKEEPT